MHLCDVRVCAFVVLARQPTRCLCVCLSICLSVCLPVDESGCFVACLPVCLHVCKAVCLSVCLLFVCLFVCTHTRMCACVTRVRVYVLLLPQQVHTMYIHAAKNVRGSTLTQNVNQAYAVIDAATAV